MTTSYEDTISVDTVESSIRAAILEIYRLEQEIKKLCSPEGRKFVDIPMVFFDRNKHYLGDIFWGNVRELADRNSKLYDQIIQRRYPITEKDLRGLSLIWNSHQHT